MKINWSKFCDVESGRYDLDEPFVIGGIKYATNARILIAVPCDEPDVDFTERRIIKQPDRVFEGFDKVVVWEPWPIEAAVTCPHCLDRVTQFVPAGRCQFCKCTGQDDEYCDDCGGEGMVASYVSECDQCTTQDAHHIGLKRIAQRYINAIATLPQPIVCGRASSDEKQPLFFKFDGGRGIVMPKVY